MYGFVPNIFLQRNCLCQIKHILQVHVNLIYLNLHPQLGSINIQYPSYILKLYIGLLPIITFNLKMSPIIPFHEVMLEVLLPLQTTQLEYRCYQSTLEEHSAYSAVHSHSNLIEVWAQKGKHEIGFTSITYCNEEYFVFFFKDRI